MGLDSGYPPEMWNIEKPENVASNHREILLLLGPILFSQIHLELINIDFHCITWKIEFTS